MNAYKLFGISGHELYNRMLKSGWTWLWPLKMRLNKLLVRLNYDVGVKIFEDYWREQQPDMVVSVAPLYNKGLWESLQRGKPGTPVVTIITDFADCPPAFWIEPETGNYLVCGTERAVEQARSLGVEEERIIKTSGRVIHPRFYEPISCDRRTERQRLGLEPDCLTGLVLFGGSGSKVMLEIAKHLECFQQNLQLIFICGRNEQLALALRESQGLQKRFVTTFTKDIPYYMHLSDFFIGKPGSGSISEALAMKLPVIVERNYATLIHERYNTDWIQQKDVGLVIRSFRNIAQAVEKFIQPENFARYRANVAAVNNQAVFEIPDILHKILATSYKTTVTEPLESVVTAMNRGRVKAITLATMCFALFMANLDDTVVTVALPKIQISLGSGVSGLQWILNAYTLPAASLVLTSGTLGDIYGRKRVFLAGLVVFTIASLVCGLAPNLGTLIAGRTLQGIGAAALVPGSLSILADAFPEPKEKAKAIGIWAAVSGIALVAGPVLGGLLVDTLGWQSVFFLNVPLGAIAFWVTSRVIRESKNPRKQRLDVPGLVLSVVLLASLTYALTEGNAVGWQSPLKVLLLAVAGLSLLGFLVVESHSSQPMLPLHLFKNPTFAIVNVVSVLVFFTLVSLLFIFSLFLQQVQGYSAVAAGLRFLPMNGGFVIASLVSGWFAALLGWRFAITAGLLLAGVATLSFIRISADTEYGAIMWNLVLSGFGAGLTLAPLTAVAMSSTPPHQAGIASAVLNTSNRLGGVLGIALQGTILTQRLASDLARSLMAWNLPSNLQERLIADALHGEAKVPSDLPASISGLALHQAISNAFVSGLHAAVLVASVALLTGALLILAFVQPTFKGRSKF